MRINIQPTARTQALLKNFANAERIVNKAKRAGMVKATNVMRMKAVEKAPIAKGILRKSILTDVSPDGEEGRVYSDLDYALYQEEGTGIYGKRGRPITPKRARFLRFKSKSGKIVFARRVKGVRAKWFMKKASEYVQTQTGVVSKAIADVLEGSL